MVRKERLELSHLATLEPKSSASTNSATFANSTGSNYIKLTLDLSFSISQFYEAAERENHSDIFSLGEFNQNQ